MYKYFKELDNPNNFKLHLTRNREIEKRNIIAKTWLSSSLLKQYETIFKRINIIDTLIKGTQYELLPNRNLLECSESAYDEWDNIYKFFMLKEETYPYINKKNQLELEKSDLEIYLRTYLHFCFHLEYIYPEYKDFLSITENMIENVLKQLNEKLELPPLSKGIEYVYPNAWYITPTGYLYNTGGENGHQGGNLTNSLLLLSNAIKNNGYIPSNSNFHKDIMEILKNEYVPWEYYKNYSNKIYSITTVITPEVELDIEKEKEILKQGYSDKNDYNNYPHPERIYQKNAITLVTGYLSAEAALANSLARLNKSKHKKEIIEKLFEITRREKSDILVRYSGFHKIESVLKNTITTSSLKGIENFKEYLDQGWNLHIIPGIVYDKTRDELTEVDFNSCYIQKHLDKEISNYTGKGKILIKK